MKTAIIEYKYYKNEAQENIAIIETAVYDHLCTEIVVSNHPIENSRKKILLNHTNKGKDIGAKLIGIDYLLSTDKQFDMLILLHDKLSPHSPLGNYWGNELTKIFRTPYWEIVEKEMQNKKTGICCSTKYIKTEYDKKSKKFLSTNNDLLQSLINKYELHAAYPYFFVAGTIFCCKWEPLRKFFMNNSPLKIRALLESGNVQDSSNGTFTHSWERLFSWIITSQGYLIKGV